MSELTFSMDLYIKNVNARLHNQGETSTESNQSVLKIVSGRGCCVLTLPLTDHKLGSKYSDVSESHFSTDGLR